MATTRNDAGPGRLSIMAGRGALPLMVLEAARRAGWMVQFQSFEPRDGIEAEDYRNIDIRKPLDIVLGIRRFKATHICMAGGVHVSDKGREGFFKLFGSKKKASAPSGDSGIAKLGRGLEIATGARLVGVHEVMPEILAEDGPIAGPKAGKTLLADGMFALQTAISAGRLDLGQAVVCSGQRVVAVEDIAGTDALMDRVAGFRRDGLVGDGKSMLILAKAKKPNQPMFADLPAIGPGTIETAHRAGISAIVVEAGRSIVIERAELVALADRFGIGVYGMTADGR